MSILEGRSAWEFLDSRRKHVATENLSTDDLPRLISLTLLTIHMDIQENRAFGQQEAF